MSGSAGMNTVIFAAPTCRPVGRWLRRFSTRWRIRARFGRFRAGTGRERVHRRFFSWHGHEGGGFDLAAARRSDECQISEGAPLVVKWVRVTSAPSFLAPAAMIGRSWDEREPIDRVRAISDEVKMRVQAFWARPRVGSGLDAFLTQSTAE